MTVQRTTLDRLLTTLDVALHSFAVSFRVGPGQGRRRERDFGQFEQRLDLARKGDR